MSTATPGQVCAVIQGLDSRTLIIVLSVDFIFRERGGVLLSGLHYQALSSFGPWRSEVSS